MLEGFLRLKTPLLKLEIQDALGDEIKFTCEDFEVLEDIRMILLPVSQATTIFQSECIPTVVLYSQFHSAMRQAFDAIERDHMARFPIRSKEFFADMRLAIFSKRLGAEALSDLHVVAGVLNPSRKTLSYNQSQKEVAYTFLSGWCRKLRQKITNEQPSPLNACSLTLSPPPPLSTVPSTYSLESFMELEVKLQEVDEVASYLDSPVEKGSIFSNNKVESNSSTGASIIRYWTSAAAQSRFPLLSQVAKLLLPLLSSSASVERLFSQLNDVVTKSRNRLGDDKICSLVTSKFNLRCFQEFDDGFVDENENVHLIKAEQVGNGAAETSSCSNFSNDDEDAE